MKKIWILLLSAICVFSFASCGQLANPGGFGRDGEESVRSYNDTGWLNDEIPNADELVEYDFNVQYIRTNGYHEGAEYPTVSIIRSVEELNAYYEANKDTYSLGRRTGAVYSDSTIGFLDACDKYDAKYFENQILLMVLLEEGSGSIRHKAERVGTNDGKVFVEISTIVPEVCTDDMAEWHILIEPEAGVDVAGKEDVVVFLNGRNATKKYTAASHSKGFANISVTLMDGWEYDIEDTDTTEFSVNIYPEGQSQNKLRIAYYNGFGVCGTGLKQEQIMLGSYEAWMGTYDNNTVWDFISLQGLPGDYAILNEGGDKWWKEYGDDAMQILATLKVADGYVTSSDAIKIARDKLQIDYDEVTTAYNAADGIWTVTLTSASGDDREVMKVTVDVYGSIIDMHTVD